MRCPMENDSGENQYKACKNDGSAPSPAIQSPAQPQPQPAPRRRKPQNPWVMPWILQRQEKGCYSNLLANLIHRHPRVPEFCQDVPCLFYFIEEHIHHHIKKSVTNFRKSLEVGLKLAITLRHLASLQYHGLVGCTTICKFVPQVCRAILGEFQDEYMHWPDSPDEWKKVEEKFRTRWNVPHAVGAIDGKHSAMKKPKKTGSDYYNYKNFFFLLLALVVQNTDSCG